METVSLRTEKEIRRHWAAWAAALLALLFLVGPAPLAPAQTRISSYTLLSQPGDNDDLLINRYLGPGSYQTMRIRFGDLKTNILGTVASYTSNYVYGLTNLWQEPDTYISNWFYTNVLVVANVSNYQATNVWISIYTSNLFATNLVAGDTYVSNFYATNVTVAGDTYVSNFYATNIYSPTLYVTTNYTTNLYVERLQAKTAYVTNIYITDGFGDNLSVTNLSVGIGDFGRLQIRGNSYYGMGGWPGPTNTWDISAYNYWLHTNTSDTQITDWTNAMAASSNSLEFAVLFFTNAASSNVTIRIPTNWATLDGAKSWTLTNGTRGVLSANKSPLWSSAVFRWMQ